MNDPQAPEEILALLMSAGQGNFMRQVEDELRSQTFVGGKRVRVQPLPKLPAAEVATVRRVKVTLYGSKPPIWRRLEIPSFMTLDDVHEVMQIAFGWYGMHLHCFETVYGRFGPPDTDDDWGDEPDKDETTVVLGQVARTEKDKVVYIYDFGDDWRHDIVVEKILPAEPGVAYPRCTAGRRHAPEEDSGGIWAFEEDSDAGEPFDPAAVTEMLESVSIVLTA